MYFNLFQEFERTVGDLQTLWAPAFIKYFNNHLKCDMTTKACKWVVESIGLYNEWSGITTNAVESINAVISQSFSTPAKIDEAVLILHHLTGYYNYEVDRGLCNVGKFIALPRSTLYPVLFHLFQANITWPMVLRSTKKIFLTFRMTTFSHWK